MTKKKQFKDSGGNFPSGEFALNSAELEKIFSAFVEEIEIKLI